MARMLLHAEISTYRDGYVVFSAPLCIQVRWFREAALTDCLRNIQMAAALNLALDLAVLILPLTELWKLSMTLRKKLQILSMFCVGFL